MEEKDVNIRTFNAAKLFAEKILFPLIEQYQNYQRQSDFGSVKLEDSIILDQEVRDIERYNGLKAMGDVTINLAMAIKSTVYLKKNKQEIAQLEATIAYMDKIKTLFQEKKDYFFRTSYRGVSVIETLDRGYFEEVKRIIQACYINIEILMTRNKLLFSDAGDEYKTDEELMEEIKKEYEEG